MQSSWRWSIPACLGLLCIALPACMEVPLVIPELNYVSPVDVGADSAEVHAFRVDVTKRALVNIDSNFKAAGGSMACFELTPVPVSSAGTTPLEWDLSCAYGWRYVGIWGHWPTLTTHSVAVRLYRRGFATEEVRAGQQMPEEWKKAFDLADKEKAIDDLLGVSPLESKSPQQTIQCNGYPASPALELGTRSHGHRESLLFAAREYAWLAEQLSDPDGDELAIRLRLLDKAGRLRELADGKVHREPTAKTH